MVTLVQALQYQIEYSIWATERLLNAATTLTPGELDRDFGSGSKSIRGTLIHISNGERHWLNRLFPPARPAPEPFPTEWSTVIEQWPILHQRWRDFAQTLTDESLSATLEYRTIKGDPRRNAIWALILHVVNHGTHHRGQVSGFIRALGKTPPSLDSVNYARELGI